MTQATKKKKRVSAVIQILLEISYSSPKTESETRKLKSTLETNIQIYEENLLVNVCTLISLDATYLVALP